MFTEAGLPGLFRRSLLVLMVVGVAINVGTFRSTEPENSERYQALNIDEEPDVLAIGRRVSPHFVQFYAPALDLAHVAPGVELIVTSQDHPLFDEEFRVRMLGFGQVANIALRDVDPVEGRDLIDWEPFAVAQGEGGDRGPPYVIALADGEPERIVALGDEALLVLADERLLPAGWLREVTS